MTNKLQTKDEKELQNFLKELEDYTSSDKKYYIIPLPNEIPDFFIKMYDEHYSVDKLRKILSYLDMICEYYENYDYGINFKYYLGIFTNSLNIDEVKITKKQRKLLKTCYNMVKERIEEKKLQE